MHFELGVEVSGSQPLISLGLGVLALKIYNDATPKEILSVDKKFFETIGLNVGLTPTRNNGFASILDKIYKSATVYSMIFDKKTE
jgi:cysteine desulfuration protein SufE